MLLRIIEIIMI